MQVREFMNWMEFVAPKKLAAPWDHVGLQVGNPSAEVTSIVLTLDMTDEALECAKRIGANLIVAHHPLFFSPLYEIQRGNPRANRVFAAIREDISLFVAHTNLDAAEGGVNDILAKTLGLKDILPVELDHESAPFMRIGNLGEPCDQVRFVSHIKQSLSLAGLRVGGKEPSVITQVAVASGSGSDAIDVCRLLGVDVLVTGDVKYHDFQKAAEAGIFVVDAGHYETEVPVLDDLAQRIYQEWKIPVCVEKARGFLLQTIGENTGV